MANQYENISIQGLWSSQFIKQIQDLSFEFLKYFLLDTLRMIYCLFTILYRRDVLQEIVNMQNYEGVFLPVALR